MNAWLAIIFSIVVGPAIVGAFLVYFGRYLRDLDAARKDEEDSRERWEEGVNRALRRADRNFAKLQAHHPKLDLEVERNGS